MFLSSFSLIAVPVTAVVKGKVVNDKNEPVEFATAVLLSPVTGEVVKGEVCNEKGEFNINKVEKGEYVLSISMVGYKKVETNSTARVVATQRYRNRDVQNHYHEGRKCRCSQ